MPATERVEVAGLEFEGPEVKHSYRARIHGFALEDGEIGHTYRISVLGFALEREPLEIVLPLGGTLSFGGALSTLYIPSVIPKALTGTLSFGGALATAAAFNKALTGGLSFNGALAAAIVKQQALAGGLSFSGALSSDVDKHLTGGLSFGGALSTYSDFHKTLAGTLSFGGVLTPVYIDAGAPEATPLLVTRRMPTSISLAWLCTHDNAGPPPSGTAAGFDISYRTEPSLTLIEYNTVPPTVDPGGEPPPGIPGVTIETMTISGLTPSTQYTFGLQSYDEVANRSPLTIVTTSTTAPAAPGDFVIPRGVTVIRGQIGRFIR